MVTGGQTGGHSARLAGQTMAEIVPWQPPVSATDCHFHIFDDRFQTRPGGRKLSAPVPAYRLVQKALGLSRGVIVAPSSYGYDNACLFDALEQFDAGQVRAVAIPPADHAKIPWDDWHADGVRGLRLYTAHDDFPKDDALLRLAKQAADRGWNLQFVGEQHREPFALLASVLAQLPCNIVFDHFGFVAQPGAQQSATAEVLRRLLDGGRTWIKLSGMYIQSCVPDWTDFDALAEELITRAPQRMLWGTDWPHTLAPVKPDGMTLLHRLRVWSGSAGAADCILVDNPARLYWGE